MTSGAHSPPPSRYLNPSLEGVTVDEMMGKDVSWCPGAIPYKGQLCVIATFIGRNYDHPTTFVQ